MSDQEIAQKLDQVKKALDKIENYIKVIDCEGYSQVNSLVDSMDYFSLDYLKKNNPLRDKLKEDWQLMIRARIKDDFREFCRRASLQIELLLDELLHKMEDINKIEVLESKYGKISRIKIKETDQEVDVFNIQDRIDYCLNLIATNTGKRYIDVSLIFKVRNLSSHRDVSMLQKNI